MQYCRRFNDAPSERYQVINPDAPLLTLMEYSTKASDVSEILSGSIDPDSLKLLTAEYCSLNKQSLVPSKGLEPSRPFGHNDLNVARLPIPPTGQIPVPRSNRLSALRHSMRSYRCLLLTFRFEKSTKLVPKVGIKPTASFVPRKRSITELRGQKLHYG